MLTLLLVLRWLSVLAIVGFGIGLGYLMWRDLQLSSRLLAEIEPLDNTLSVIKSVLPDLKRHQKFPLSRVTGIGRALDNTIVLDDDYTSNHHALISLRDGQWWIEDLHSRNGVLVNQEPIKRATPVSVGDTILIGSTLFKLEHAETPE